MKVLLPLLRTSTWMLSSSSSTTTSTILHSAVDDSTSTTIPSSFVQNLPPLAKNSRRFVLLRHGETDWTVAGKLQGGGHDLDLNERGQEQAKAAQRALAGFKAGVVASSHLERAYQTADIVQAAFVDYKDRPVRVINHKFGEMRFGEFEGTQIRTTRKAAVTTSESRDQEEEMVAASRRKFLDFQNNILHQNKHAPWPGGESVANVEQRAIVAIQQLMEHFPQVDSFCIVAHGRFNKLLLRALLGFTGYNSFEQGNACINVLDVDQSGNWKARVINHMGHVHSVDLDYNSK